MTVTAHGSTIGNLTVEEGAFISEGSNTFKNLTASTIAGAGAEASITLNQGDAVDGRLTTEARSSITLVGLSTNLKGISNAGTLELTHGSSIVVGGDAGSTENPDFISSGTINLTDSSLKVFQNVIITGDLNTGAANLSSSFIANGLTINGASGSFNLSSGINTVTVTNDLVMDAGTASINGALLVGHKTDLSGGASLALTPVGDSQSNLGILSVRGSGTRLALTSDSLQTVRADSVVVADSAGMSLNGINLMLNSGLGSLVLSGSFNPDAPASLVEFSTSRVEGSISAVGYNELALQDKTVVTGDLTVTAGGLNLHGAGSLELGGDALLYGDLNLASPAGLSASSMTIVSNRTATINGTLRIAGQTTVSGASLVLEDVLAGSAVQNFGSLGTVDILGGSVMTITGRDKDYQALLAGNISVSDQTGVAGKGNTLTLSNAVLSGDVSMEGAADLNTFNMSDARIKGDLRLYGGTFNSYGSNRVDTATIGSNAVVNIVDGTLKADNIRLEDNVHMSIDTRLDAGLVMAGTGVVVDMNSTFQGPGAGQSAITGNLTVNAGLFNYTSGAVGGKVILNGSSMEDARIMVLGNWDMSPSNGLDMQNFGLITVTAGHRLAVNGAVSNKGTLVMAGEGDFLFAASGSHSGNMEFRGSGHLTLDAENALGNGGTLYLTQSSLADGSPGNAYMNVSASQGKNLTSVAVNLIMTAVRNGGLDPVFWNGIMHLRNLTLNPLDGAGSNLTLASQGSTIDNLVLDASKFKSNGGNSFGSIDLTNSGDLTLSSGDTITGFMTSDSSTITLDGVTANMQGLTNHGTLNLINNSHITVSGNLESSGTLLVDSSSLSVTNLTTLGITKLHNAALSGSASVDINGEVTTLPGNVSTSFSAGSLNIHSGAFLNMNEGLASVTVSHDLTVMEGSRDSSLRGNLNVGGLMTLEGGALRVMLSGEKPSSLGTVSIRKGGLDISSADSQRVVTAQAMTVEASTFLRLANVNLKLNEGNGTLTLNGTALDQPAASLISLTGSMITGNVQANLHNGITVSEDTAVTGTLNVDGILELGGSGALSLGNLILKDGHSVVNLTGTVNIAGGASLNGGSLNLTTNQFAHNFGSLGTVVLDQGSALSVSGMGPGDARASVSGNITLAEDGGNTLTLANTRLTGNVTLGDHETNTLTMADSDILGTLTLDGGYFHVTGGLSTAQEIVMGRHARMTVDQNATFKALTTVVSADALLDILGAMDGNVRVNGGTVTLGRLDPDTAAGELTGNLTVTSGIFNYRAGSVGGTLVFNGASSGDAVMNVDGSWTASAANSLDMQNYGTLRLNGSMVMNGALKGAGELTVSGDGSLTLAAAGEHTGNINYGAGSLTLNAINALGTNGTLSFTRDAASVILAADQTKNVTGSALDITVNADSFWHGSMDLDSLDKSGNHALTLDRDGSHINLLTVRAGSFTSTGANAFISIAAWGGGSGASITLNRKDSLSGTVMTAGEKDEITLNGVVAEVAGIDNNGTLNLTGKADIIVDNSITSGTGTLTITDSTLNVLKNADLHQATLVNGTLMAGGSMTINGLVRAADGNSASVLQAGSLLLDGGTLDLGQGVNTVLASGGFLLQNNSAATIGGRLNAASVVIGQGSELALNIAGSSASSLGQVTVEGLLTLNGGNFSRQTVLASSMEVASSGFLTLNNANLSLQDGIGTLLLYGGTDSSREAARFIGDSLITGHMAMAGNNMLDMEGSLKVTGDLMINGGLELVGGGAFSIGGTTYLEDGLLDVDSHVTLASSGFIMNEGTRAVIRGALDISGATEINGTLTMAVADGAEDHDFGSIGRATILDGAVFNAAGAEGHAATLSGDLMLSSDGSTSLDNGSRASLTDLLFKGSITVSADFNTLSLIRTTVAGNVSIAGSNNLFNMADSTIGGMLDIAGGTFNLSGANAADSAAISGNATVNIDRNASLTVGTTVVKPTGSLHITGTLDGALLLDGGSATLGTDDLNGAGANASITAGVTIANGEFTLNNTTAATPVGGSLTFNGASADKAVATVNTAWTLNGNMVMDGNGALNLNADMSLGGMLTGSGQLDVRGDGALAFHQTGEHTGDIFYRGTGKLSLLAENALGVLGSLYAASPLEMDVRGNQGKGVSGTQVDMNILDAGISWSGQMKLDSLTVSGGSLTLGNAKSSIRNLLVNGGGFTSEGGNTFVNVTAAGADAVFNQGDLISGKLTVGAGHRVALNSMTGTMAQVANGGTLNINDHSAISVSGAFASSGTLNLNGNSSLYVQGDLDLARTTMTNGSITTDGSMNINGLVQAAEANAASSLKADCLSMEAGGRLDLSRGINTVSVTNTLQINGGTAVINGSLVAGTSTTLHGGSLTLTAMGNTVSALGTVSILSGSLNLIGSDLAHRTITAGSMLVSGTGAQAGSLSLDNVYLSLDGGNGTLTLDGGRLSFAGGSVLNGHMNVTGNNSLSFDDSTTITGGMAVSGGVLDLAGRGNATVLNIGGSVQVASGAGMGVQDLALHISGTSTVKGTMSLATATDMGDFGSIGTMTVTEGGRFSAAGSLTNVVDDGTEGGFTGTALSGNITLTRNGANTLDMDHIFLNGDVMLARGGTDNRFNMTDSHIAGSLYLEDGQIKVTGSNYAENAYIATEATVSGDTTHFVVANMIVKAEGNLIIGEGDTPTVHGILWLDGGNATLAGGTVTRDVNIQQGTLTYRSGTVQGSVIMNGADEDAALIQLENDWNGINSLNMQNYGTVNLNGFGLTVLHALTGSGDLSVNGSAADGSGTLILSETGTHTGDINFNASRLVLGAENALGLSGTLRIMRDGVSMDVTGSQSEDVTGKSVAMTTHGTVDWKGRVDLEELSVTGDLNLAASGSSIDYLNVVSGSFASTSKSGSGFGSIMAGSGSSVTLNQHDRINGSLTTAAGSSITLNGVTSTVTEISNGGTLNLNDTADIKVNGNVSATGNINMDNSSMASTGSMNVTDVTGSNSDLAASDMTVTGNLDMTDGINSVTTKGDMTVTGNADINGSISVGGKLNVETGAGVDLNLAGTTASDLGTTEVDGTLSITGGDAGRRVEADSITVNTDGTVNLTDVNLNLGNGHGDLTLDGDGATANITDSKISGNVITNGDVDTHLTLDNSSITGNLEVNGGTFDIINANSVSGTINIQDKAHVTVHDGASLQAGEISMAPDGELVVEEQGSIGGSSISFGELDGTPGQSSVIFEGTHEISGSITMNADGTVKAGNGGKDGHVTLSGELVGSQGHTLELEATGDSTITINRGNADFSSNVDLTGNLILAASEALGKEGVLHVNDSSTLITDNGRGFGTITISKGISGHELNLVTNNNTELSGALENLDTLNKEGNRELTLNGSGSVGSLNVNSGSVTVEGAHTHYTMGGITVQADTSMNFIGESTVTGTDAESTLTTEGTVLVKNAAVDMNIAIKGGSTTLDDNAVVSGNISLQNGELNLAGTGLKLSEQGSIILENGGLDEAVRTINVKQDAAYDGTLAVHADGTLNVSSNRELILGGNLAGSASLTMNGRGTVTLQNANEGFNGTLALEDRITLVGETSNAFGSGSTLKVSGSSATIVTGTKDATETVSYDSTLDSSSADPEKQTEFELRTLADTNWKGDLTGGGKMNKTGAGTLILEQRDAADAASAPESADAVAARGDADGTGEKEAPGRDMDINVKDGALVLDRFITGNISLSGGTTLSGHAGTSGTLSANSFSSKDAVIEVGAAGNAGEISSISVGNLVMGYSSRYVVDVDMLGTAADMIHVANKTTLNGATVELRHGLYTVEEEKALADNTRWTILDSGEIEGSFSGKVDHDLYYHNVKVEHFDDHVDLVLHLNYKGVQIDNSVVNNNTFISNVIEHIENNNPGGEMGKVIEDLKEISGRDDIKNAIDIIGGVSLTPLMQTEIARNNNHMRIMRTAVESTAWKMQTKTPNLQIWAQSTSDHSELDGDGNGSEYKRNAWGGTIGVERTSLSNKVLAGLAFSYDWENWTAMGNKNKNNSGYLDLYVKKDVARWHHYGLIGLSQTNISADRTVAFGNYYNKAEADTTAYGLYFNYEATYDARIRKDSLLQLVGQVQAGYNVIDGYSEHGKIGNAGLNIQGQHAIMVELGLGAKYSREFNSFFDGAPKARYGLKALFTYDAGDIGADTDACFISDPSTRFNLKPARETRYGGLFGADVTMPYNDSTSFYMGGTYEVKSGANNATANFGVIYTF